MFCISLICFAVPCAMSPLLVNSAVSADEVQIFSADAPEVIKDDLSNAQDINYTRNALLVSDFDTKKILNIYSPADSHDLQIQPTALAADFQDNLYYSVSGYGITRIDSDNFKTSYPEYSAEVGVEDISIGEVYDLACSADGTVWAIARGYGDLKVLIYKPFDSELFYLVESLSDIGLDNNSKLAVSLDAEIIVISTTNGLFQIKDGDIISATANPEDFTYSLPGGLSDIKNIAIDHTDNLVLLSTNGNSQFIRSNSTSYIIFEDSTNLLTGLRAFALDAVSGDIYFNTATEVKKLRITDQHGKLFCNILTHEGEPDYVNELPDSVVKVAKVKTDNAYVYEFGTLLQIQEQDGERLALGADTYTIVLDWRPDSTFCFVLLTNFAEGDITGYLFKQDIEEVTATPVNYTARLVVPNTQIFSYPTSTNSQLLLENTTQPMTVVAEFTFSDYNNITFVAIDLGEGKFGYLDANCILDTATPVIEQTMVTNARTRSEVVVYADQACTIELASLDAGTNVQIIETQNGIAQIVWGLGTSFGYLAFSELDDGSLSQAQLIGLILMGLCILIAIVLITITATKNKKDKKRFKN